MEQATGSTTDLIAAAIVTSCMGRRKETEKAAGCPAECTDCPFSLIAFAVTLSRGDAPRQGSKTAKKP